MHWDQYPGDQIRFRPREEKSFPEGHSALGECKRSTYSIHCCPMSEGLEKVLLPSQVGGWHSDLPLSRQVVWGQDLPRVWVGLTPSPSDKISGQVLM